MKNLKTHLYAHSYKAVFSGMLLSIMLLFSCSGCRSGKGTETTDIIDKKIVNSNQSTTDVQSPDTNKSDSNQDNTGISLKEMDSLNKIYRDYLSKLPISIKESDDSVVDDYNVRKQILEFKNPKTLDVIKTIDLVKENPFHKMGLKRRKEPYPAVYYFLMPEGAETKNALKKFLPKETFNEIPSDFEMDRAISKIFVSITANKYVTVSYELDWLPDAYSDQGEWDGPGYGVHYAVVYDSLGNKIYTRQFDGTSQMPSVSEDGKYLFTMACLSPEWDENIRYRFSVVKINTDKVVYEELIENCKKHGGRGSFYVDEIDKRLKASSYYITKYDKTIKCYLYYENKFYIQKEYQLIDTWFYQPNRKLRIAYLDKPTEIISIDSFFNEVKLD